MNYKITPTMSPITGIAIIALAIGALTIIALFAPQSISAGIYNASTQVTYKEYWVPHSEFVANCPPVDPVPYTDRWYIEPKQGSCEPDLTFVIPDSISSAQKAEIYIDLWRNHNERSARFRLNNGPWRTPNVGSDWSRTPYVAEVPLNELNQGTNHIYFTNDGSQRSYHVHDVAIRIYHTASNPLVAGTGSDVTPPSGSLNSIVADNGTFAPNSGGTLMVDSNQLTISAYVTDTALVEFHAFYEGYDLDNDGVFREWHNRGRNNCHPEGIGCSGDATPEVGGTIDHIGTTGPTGSFSNCSWNGTTGLATCTWDLRHVVNQSGVRFKIRAIDASGNVIDAAGGDSANFTLLRNNPTAAYYNPDFVDAVLHHDGDPNFSDYYTATVQLPENVSSYDVQYLLGSYWRNPRVFINDRSLLRPFDPSRDSADDDFWTLSEIEIPTNQLSGSINGGLNYIQYEYANSFGEFIEKPGPLIVLRRTGGGYNDTTAPQVTSFEPTNGSVNIDPAQVVVAYVEDYYGVGVDYTSLEMRVNGSPVSPKISGFSNRYKLSYAPNGGFPNSTAMQVTIDAKDLKGNTMPQATYNFTIEDPDVTPPVISNISLIPGFTQAIIRWETDEPATSQVDFGATASYTGTVSNGDLVTQHEIILPDLNSASEYHFMITSADSDLNSSSTTDDTFITQLQLKIISDDFNYCSMDDSRWDKWEFVNPKGDATIALTGDELKLTVPGGVEHDIWTNGSPIIRAPHLLQNVTDPHLLHAVFSSQVTQPIQQQGILAIQDANNFVRINFQYSNGAVEFIAVRVRDGSARVIKSGIVPNGTSGEPLHLLVLRDEENRWRPRFSRDGSNWTGIGTFTEAFSINKVGIYAGNATGDGPIPAFEMSVDYFFDGDNPIAPEDATAQLLPVSANPSDKGTVTKDLECGNPVTLTAEAVPGWSFSGWSGSLGGTENPKSFAFDFGDFVIANFTQDQYSLETTEVGEGTLAYTPEQATYLYGDTVSLSATPELGWSFAGWSGDLTGMTNPAALTMDESKVVTATFTQDQYSITIGDAEGGVATVTPVQENYVYSDEVTFEAVAEDGWTFEGWSGDLTGTETPLTVQMTEDLSVTPIFSEDQYKLTTAIEPDGLNAVITINPNKEFYLYDEQVTLTANTAEPGWEFSSWTGDLDTSVNPSTISMVADQSITAVFTRTRHTVQTFISSGNGSIALTPEKPFYFYGETVLVTAVPDSGWTLDGWSGSISGRDNPVILTIDEDKSVIAAFAEAPNELTTTVTGQGMIERRPALQFYKTGDVVELNAVPEPGWRFSGWSGAASGTENPIQITMDDDKTVNATFVQLDYSVTVTVASTINDTDPASNQVNINPDRSSYNFGDNVTLTPIAAAGWTFARWGGDLMGSDNPAELEITGEMAVTAYFTPTLYTINLGVGGLGEGGTVDARVDGESDGGPYVYGQEVTLVPIADPGYVFSGWIITDEDGESTDTSSTLTVTVPDERTFQATFTVAQEQIFLPLISR